MRPQQKREISKNTFFTEQLRATASKLLFCQHDAIVVILLSLFPVGLDVFWMSYIRSIYVLCLLGYEVLPHLIYGYNILVLDYFFHVFV